MTSSLREEKEGWEWEARVKSHIKQKWEEMYHQDSGKQKTEELC